MTWKCRKSQIGTINLVAHSILGIILGLTSALSSAKEIKVTLPSGVTANADFRVGERDKPAILILHGFMSTHHLNIVQLMINELHDNEFTILAPTLSLNINDRQGGADCRSIHTHTMESDIAEILWWSAWLNKKTGKELIVIGHSTGSLQLAAMLSDTSPQYIKKAIFTAPAYLAGRPVELEKEKIEIKKAKQMVLNNNTALGMFNLSYCKGDFTAPATTFLSYKKWTASHLIASLKKLVIPFEIILGELDNRFGLDWHSQLQQANLPVVIVSEANHFFDSPAEFDFLDILLNTLNTRQ